MITQNIRLLRFLNDLRDRNIFYRLSQHRDDAIMVEAAVPGERWEIEFLEDGTVETEIFRSDGQILSENALQGLLAKNLIHG